MFNQVDNGVKLSFVLTVFLVVACSSLQAQRRTEPAPSPAPTPAASPAAPDEVLAPFKGKHAWLISGVGIGAAKIGMPVEVLQHKLGDKLVMENLSGIVGDFDGIRITLEGEALFYLLHVPDFVPTKVGDIMTNNPKFATEEGLRPGMSLADAEKICGKAILFYSDNNEQEEFVTFENQPFPNLRIRPKAAAQGKVGVYETKSAPSEPAPAEPAQIGNAVEPEVVEGQVYMTNNYQAGAVIDSITVTSSGD